MALTVRGREIKFSLAWLKPPPVPPDGNMSLYDHLRELRYRIVFAVITIAIGMIVAWQFREFFDWVLARPFEEGRRLLMESHPDINPELIIEGVTKPFTLQLKIVAVAALVGTAPIWLYQLWAFIVPGLLASEKKWALAFVGTATPLFLAGVATGYFVMPKAISVLMSFTPNSQAVTNLVDQGYFLSFLLRLMIVFGISYLVPLVMLMLNVIGVVKGAHLAKFRPFIIFGAFLFSAFATPSVDPFSMIALALPLTALMLVTEVIARFNDRRRAARDDDPIAQDKVLAELNAQDEREAAERAAVEAGDDPKALESGSTTSGDKS